ncbi:serine threonine kinase [Fusarium phyllophilum]|uniref:Serine threonine kinase n=1 Tax=Fusarium phyllophilum TaxID=47803 RepID=A0A8H5JPU6_9HYPO|nr:serine threonine kinase [Fusarium phyllophilum]
MSSQNSITNVELFEPERNFDRICDASHNYPQTAPSGRRSTRAQQAVATTWNREAARIFHPRSENACLKIFETCDCMTPCNCQSLSGDVKTMEDLLLRLQPNKKAPKMRYVSSKDQVRCPIKMFKYLCTYQQIPPSFLSCLYSFRRSHSAQEWCNLPQFNDDNTLLSSEDDILPLDRMGLSGREIRYSFVLRSVESSTSVPNRSWGIRQLAVYHSFDIKREVVLGNLNEKEDPWGGLGERVKRLERLEVFSFDELQKLQQGLETIQEALLVLKLNNQVIRQIREHYQCLMTQYRLPALKEIKKGCEDSFLRYCRHSRNIEANIDAHQAQLNALLLLVNALDEAAGDRRREILTHGTLLADGSFGECFHNSSKALTCVVKSHSAALDALQGPVFLSRNVCSLVEHWMLVPYRERQSPILIWKNFERNYREIFHPVPPLGRHSPPLLPQPGFHNTPILTQSPMNMTESLFQPDRSPHQWSSSHPGPSRQIGTALDRPDMHQRDPLGINTRMSSNNGTPIGRHTSAQWSYNGFQAISELEDKSFPASAISTKEFNLGNTSGSPMHPGISFSAQDYHYHSVPDANNPFKTSADITRLTPQKQNEAGMYGDLTIDNVVSHRKKNGKRESLEGYEKFRNRMGNRRFVFIIDDSETMRDREREVLKVLEVLVWLVWKIDQSGPEIRFTSKPDKKFPIERRPRFLLKMELMRDALDKFINPVRQWLSGNDAETLCNMKHSFNQIFSEVNMVDPKRPTSVIILTDGIWEQGGSLEEKGVEACITKIIKRMEDKGIGDTAFAFQFVSFGNDPVGLRRLKYLDDDALYGGNEDNRTQVLVTAGKIEADLFSDIVDHKSSESNVWAILTGSVSPGNDKISASPSIERPSYSQGE